MDLTWFYANDDHHGYELDRVFGHSEGDFAIEEATFKDIFKITGQIPNCSKKHGRFFEKFRRYPNRLLKNNLAKSRKDNIIDALSETVSYERLINLDTSKDWYIIGFWIEEAFWKNRIDSLKKELRFDDPKWVTEEFSEIGDKTVVDINSGNDSFRDVQLMSLCKHKIIANSTFSTWASILNDNEGHMTVYPKDYLKDEDSEIKSIEGWIRI